MFLSFLHKCERNVKKAEKALDNRGKGEYNAEKEFGRRENAEMKMYACESTAKRTTMAGAEFCGRPSFDTENFEETSFSIADFVADGAVALSALFVVLILALGALLLGRVLCLLVLALGVVLSLLVRIIGKKKEASRTVQRCARGR